MIKTFKDYWKSLGPDEKRALAARCGLSNETMLSQIANNHRKAGVKTISKLQAIDPRLTTEFMRPDLFEGRTAKTKRSV